MQPPTTPPPWADPAWSAEADAWVASRLERIGARVTGPAETRTRPWSAVRHVPTTRGMVHLKATASAMADDAVLSPLLAGLRPDLVLAPLAVEPGRRWMLLPDGGARLRDARSGAGWVATWMALLPRYAELQIATRPLVAELLTAGALDRRLDRLPALIEDLLADDVALGAGGPDGLTDAEIRALLALMPRLRAACGRLRDSGLGDTIQHDDLHDGNVVIGERSAHIIDWGDAAVAHPLGTLLVTLNSAADHLGLPDDAPDVSRLADAYFEPWTVYLAADRLRALMPLARWTAMVGRALTWQVALRHATVSEWHEWRGAISGWLRELMAEAPLELG